MIIAAGVLAWGGLGLLVAIALARTVRERETRERPSCCPHPEAEAPDAVRGEFRAVVTELRR